ncbi:MAG TPA: FadR/GntR family transcriptional regulator [Devosiaceae bacterium]|nr:FadR/GntR family transcriptional regulator [Devosiaceae bacterium]
MAKLTKEPDAGPTPTSVGGDAFADLIAGRAQPPGIAAEFGGETLERRSISEQVASRILGMIKSGNLKSGDRLPTEQQMSIALGISRPPLREALKALTLMGVLESRQGGRYTVTDLSPSRLVAPFNVMLSIQDYDVKIHYEARLVVELALMRFCGDRASDKHRARILDLAHDGESVTDDPVAFRLNDAEFHQAIYVGAGNVLLATVAQGLYDIALDLRRIASSLPGVMQHSVADHIRIADALVARDTDGAVEAYRQHLEHVRETTIQSLVGMTDKMAEAYKP